MKVLVYIAFLLLPSLSEACLCNGITAATCATAPCTIKCGLCQEHCCSFPFGREDLNEDTERLLLPCLGWEEVTACIERFGAFFQDLDFPTEEDFNLFDVNEDGTLVYDEWKQSMSE